MHNLRLSVLHGMVFLMWVAFPLVAQAESFCAATVSVSDADGQPAVRTYIELRDAEGKVVMRQLRYENPIRICDFGFGPHTLRVGTNECLPVSIENLRVVFGQPLHLKVVMNYCGYREQLRNACLLYLRVRDSSGKAVAGVSFSPPLVVGLPSVLDVYGRYQSRFRGRHDIRFTKEGFEPTNILVECKGNEEVDREVVMKRIAEK